VRNQSFFQDAIIRETSAQTRENTAETEAIFFVIKFATEEKQEVQKKLRGDNIKVPPPLFFSLAAASGLLKKRESRGVQRVLFAKRSALPFSAAHSPAK